MTKLDDLINNYFSRSLTQNERQEIRHLLKTDPEFKERFEFEKDVRSALISEKKEKLRSTFRNVEKNQPKAESNNSNLTKYLIAASIAILLGFLGFNYFNAPITNEKLFAQNFEPYRNIIEPVTRANGTKTEKQKAFEDYENGAYKIAIASFEKLYESTGETYYLFYIANAEMAEKNTTAAIKTLETHQRYKDEFSEKSQWYLALAYLSNNETEKAKTLLKTILENETYNYKKARELLKNL